MLSQAEVHPLVFGIQIRIPSLPDRSDRSQESMLKNIAK